MTHPNLEGRIVGMRLSPSRLAGRLRPPSYRRFHCILEDKLSMVLRQWLEHAASHRTAGLLKHQYQGPYYHWQSLSRLRSQQGTLNLENARFFASIASFLGFHFRMVKSSKLPYHSLVHKSRAGWHQQPILSATRNQNIMSPKISPNWTHP